MGENSKKDDAQTVFQNERSGPSLVGAKSKEAGSLGCRCF